MSGLIHIYCGGRQREKPLRRWDFRFGQPAADAGVHRAVS